MTSERTGPEDEVARRRHLRLWRTQVHFLTEDPHEPGTWLVRLPGWERDDVVRLRVSELPVALTERLEVNHRCHCRVNLGAESPVELVFGDWDLSV